MEILPQEIHGIVKQKQYMRIKDLKLNTKNMTFKNNTEWSSEFVNWKISVICPIHTKSRSYKAQETTCNKKYLINDT